MKNQPKVKSEISTIRTIYGEIPAKVYINESFKRIDVIINLDGNNFKGTSICHENDTFSVKWGIEMAKKKAKKNFYSAILGEHQRELKQTQKIVGRLKDLIQIEKDKIQYSLNKKYPKIEDTPSEPTVEVEINEILETEQEVEIKAY